MSAFILLNLLLAFAGVAVIAVSFFVVGCRALAPAGRPKQSLFAPLSPRVVWS